MYIFFYFIHQLHHSLEADPVGFTPRHVFDNFSSKLSPRSKDGGEKRQIFKANLAQDRLCYLTYHAVILAWANLHDDLTHNTQHCVFNRLRQFSNQFFSNRDFTISHRISLSPQMTCSSLRRPTVKRNWQPRNDHALWALRNKMGYIWDQRHRNVSSRKRNHVYNIKPLNETPRCTEVAALFADAASPKAGGVIRGRSLILPPRAAL